MLLRPLLPDHRSLTLDEVRLTAKGINVFVASVLPNNQCPLCGQSSTRVHSWYQRKLADLPWQGLTVSICWRNRKFFCDNRACPRRVFTERLPEVTRPYSRKTCRMAVVLAALGFACGGEGGARLAERLAVPVSADSLLRIIRQTVLPEIHTPRVVGVDDWAFWRGQRYGTILCDLEQHQRIDLLPDRSAESLANWLKAHPSVEIVSRDRGDFYIKGATAGAPAAIQVTDRWHLLKNLHEVLSRAVDLLVRIQAACHIGNTIGSHALLPIYRPFFRRRARARSILLGWMENPNFFRTRSAKSRDRKEPSSTSC